MHGVQVESNQDDAGRHLGYISNGSWTRHLIEVATPGDYTLKVKLATGVNGNNSIVVKNQAESIIGTLNVNPSASEGWHDWVLDSTDITLSAGVQEITLEFVGEDDYLFNLDWFEITPRQDPVSTHVISSQKPQLSIAQIQNAEGLILRVLAPTDDLVKLNLYNTQGQSVFAKYVHGNTEFAIDTENRLRSGVYQAVLSNSSVQTSLRQVVSK
jgi:alpha-L-fucosidase 2